MGDIIFRRRAKGWRSVSDQRVSRRRSAGDSSITGGGFDNRKSKRPNRAMEVTTSGRHNLLFVSLNTYPVAMRGFARSDSSWSHLDVERHTSPVSPKNPAR